MKPLRVLIYAAVARHASSCTTAAKGLKFTREIFARLRLDYSNIQSRVRPQLVLGWTPSPGTAVYAGYNDDLNYNGYNPYNGRLEPGFSGNGRSFFIKMSYLFRKSL